MQKLQIREEVAILAVNQNDNKEAASSASGDSAPEMECDQMALQIF